MPADNTKMFMGLPETSNADGPIGFIDIPTTNDKMVGRDFYIARKLALFSVMTGAGAAITFVVYHLGYLEVPWLLLAMVIFLTVWTANVWYFANYRGQQKQERDYLQSAAIHIIQLQTLKEALAASAKIAEAEATMAAAALPVGSNGDMPSMDQMFGEGI